MSEAPPSATIHPFHTAEQIEQHVSTLLELTKLTEFREDIEKQAQAFERMQVLWPQLTTPHKLNIKTRVVEALTIPEARFDYLIEMRRSASDLRLGLEWRRSPFTRQEDERIYPGHNDGWLGRYLAYAEVGEAHIGWHFWAGLLTLAAACRRNFYITVGHKPMYPNLYVMLEGPSGSGKNTAIERSRNMLQHMNARLVERAEHGLDRVPTVGMLPARITVRGLFNNLQLEGSGKRLIGPLTPVMKASDYEIAAILISPEAAYLIGKENFDAAALIVAFTQAYDGWMEDSTGIHGNISLNNLVVSMLLGSTMSWLRSNITPEVFQGGFMGARCLVIPKARTSRNYPWEPIVDPIQREALVDYLCHFANHAPTQLKLSQQANYLYEDWYARQERESEDDRINAYFQRKRVYIPKLAMLFAISRNHIPVIEGDDMQSAIDLLQWEEPAMLECFRQMISPSENTHTEWLIGILHKNGGRLKKSELARAGAARLTGLGLREVLITMEAQGLIAHMQTTGGGKPPITWYYLPDMWDEQGNRKG